MLRKIMITAVAVVVGTAALQTDAVAAPHGGGGGHFGGGHFEHGLAPHAGG